MSSSYGTLLSPSPASAPFSAWTPLGQDSSSLLRASRRHGLCHDTNGVTKYNSLGDNLESDFSLDEAGF